MEEMMEILGAVLAMQFGIFAILGILCLDLYVYLKRKLKNIERMQMNFYLDYLKYVRGFENLSDEVIMHHQGISSTEKD